MNQSELLGAYRRDRPMLQAWGGYVAATIGERIRNQLGGDADGMLKIPPQARTKDEDSLIEKAFYRGKNYNNPYAEITDKVGTRFVVLLVSQIHEICNILESAVEWTASRDRDFEEERRKQPAAFEYQSMHYVVRAGKAVEIDGTKVPEGVPCEVQIRTLLQHAFSELTHDTVYKPQTMAVPAVLRDIAKSMALIETTDDLFTRVSDTIQGAVVETERWARELSALYAKVVKREPAPNPRANAMIIESVSADLANVTITDVAEGIRKFPLDRWVAERAENNLLFRQPAILLAYYLAKQNSIQLPQRWPFTPEELGPIWSDVGISDEWRD